MANERATFGKPSTAPEPEDRLSAPGSTANDSAPARARGTGIPSGRVKFDERGNAVWEWVAGTVNIDPAVAAQRLRRLENSTLAIVEEPAADEAAVVPNPTGTVKGYNPYNSGKLEGRQDPPRKRDLRRLSEWIQLRKQAARNKKES